MKNRLFIKFCILALLTVLIFTFSACSNKNKGDLIAKMSSRKIYQTDIDSIINITKGMTSEEAKIKKINAWLDGEMGQWAQYFEYKKLGFLKTDTVKTILRIIEDAWLSGEYKNVVLKTNWGFDDSEILAYYNAHKEEYKLNAPKQDKEATDAQKKKLAEYQENPYKTLQMVKQGILIELALNTQELKDSYNKYLKEFPDSIKNNPQLFSAEKIKLKNELSKNYSNNLEATFLEKLKKDRKVKLIDYKVTLTETDLREYFKINKDKYRRSAELKVKHIAVKSQKIAEKIYAKLNAKGNFDILQKQYTINKKSKGKLISVNKGAKITEIDGNGTSVVWGMINRVGKGRYTGPIKLKIGPFKNTWNIFLLETVEAAELKSFEEARPEFEEILRQEKSQNIPDNAVIGSMDGKELLFGEVAKMLYKRDANFIKKYKGKLRNQLIEKIWLPQTLFADYARSKGMLKSKELQKNIEDNQRSFIIWDFATSVFEPNLGFSDKEIQNCYNKNKAKFNGAELSKVKNKVFDILLSPEEKSLEYYNNNKASYLDKDWNLKSYESVKESIAGRLNPKARAMAKVNFIRNLTKKHGLKIYVEKYNYQKSSKDLAVVAFDAGKKASEDRKTDLAIREFVRVKKLDPSYKKKKVNMVLGQLYQEKRQYKNALKEYYNILLAEDKDSSAYKAQFMIGFIFSDFLQDTTNAIKAYNSLLKDYPKCDLAPDTKILVDHLINKTPFKIFEDDKKAK